MLFLEDFSLKSLNTFGLSYKAKYFYEAAEENNIQNLLSHSIYLNNKHLILGGGSNILFTKDYDGLIIKNNIKGIEKVKNDNNHVWIKAKSGEIWHDLVLHCIKNYWGGIENLSLIPGTVGAAPIQNIGAYGVEVKDVFDSLTAIEKSTGKTKTFNYDECMFGYRESVFKNMLKDQYIITSVTFKLTASNHCFNTSYGAIKEVLGDTPVTIKNISDAVIKIRQSKLPDPTEIGNSGSFFKNPTIDKIDYEGLQAEFPAIPGYHLPELKVKVPAGWLIEQCGWKGKRLGEIGVHDKQALVLVNYGNGSGAAIKQLANDIQKSVTEKFGITIQPEVNFV